MITPKRIAEEFIFFEVQRESKKHTGTSFSLEFIFDSTYFQKQREGLIEAINSALKGHVMKGSNISIYYN